MRRAALAVLLGSLAGCAPAAVDYAKLEDAANARQRWADGQARQGSRDVKRLLAQPLTLDSAARIALLNNRGARAAAEELGIAQAEAASAWRVPNPTLEGALRFHGAGEPEIELGAMLDLSAFLLHIPRGNAAEADVASAKLEAVGVLVDLAYDARRALIDVQAALERLELRKTVLSSFEASALAAERLRQAGNITQLTLAAEQAQREEARLELEQARAGVEVARQQLNGLLGVFGANTGWTVQPGLSAIPERELALERLERDALVGSLEMSAARERYTAAARHLGVARASGWLPELKAGVSAERSDEWGIGPAVELELPLFYQGQGEVGVARAQQKQAEHSYADLAVQVRRAARAAKARLETARRGVIQARDVILPLRQRVLEQTQLEYNGMLVGVFELLQVKREHLSAAEQYLDLRQRYWLARLDVEQLLAGRRAAPQKGQ